MRNSMLHITNVNRVFSGMARANTHINTKTSNSSVRVWLTSMLLLCFSFAAVTPVTANAQEDVASIIAKSEKAAYYAGNDGKSMARMIIVDSQGRKQMRQFTILRKDVLNNEGTESGDQKMLVFFLSLIHI